jgi:hypothetical protein
VTVPRDSSFPFDQQRKGHHMKFKLNEDETEIDHWTIYYRPNDKVKLSGKLTVSDQRLVYHAKFDASILGQLAYSLAVPGSGDDEGYFIIDKKDIVDVSVEKKMLSKRVLVTMNDQSVHIFDYGALSVDKVAEAIRA